jgi:aminopeptidase
MSKDTRYTALADVLTGFSTALKKGEHVLIDAFDIPSTMVVELVRAARRRGAVPHVQLHQARITRELYRGATVEQYKTLSSIELYRMKKIQAYIGLRGSDNIFEMGDVPPERMKQVMKLMHPVLERRVNDTKWVVLRWPSPAMAQQAMRSTEAFEDFYFKVCTLDYSRMIPGMKALKTLMKKTDRVHLTGPGTDLHFSIKGMTAIPCGGKHNIPDGEVFTAPIRDSVEGEITYNVPTLNQGVMFDKIRLIFKKGKIVEATANNTRRLNQILDSDPGARYIGEFAIGFNPHITEPMLDILFDEKIAGSFHFTPGQAYEQADNGNRSQVHWDLVNIQRKDWGGGEIRFDGKTIRKDGIFLPKSLQKLNPPYLLGKS